jgi:long-chain acyl-CoA synthetase
MEFTCRDVDIASGRVAAGLRAAGLARGDTVAVQLPNLPEFVFAYFGALKAGITLMPLNPLLRAPEVAYHLQDSGARILVTVEAFAGEAARGAAEAGNVPVYVVGAPVDGASSFDDLYADEDSGDVEPLNSDDTAVIIYTSGTTGRPKGAELTHFQMYMACTVAGQTFGYRTG